MYRNIKCKNIKCKNIKCKMDRTMKCKNKK